MERYSKRERSGIGGENMSKQNGSVHGEEVLASASVAGGSVSIGKAPEQREDGYVVTYTVSSSAGEPIAVSFEDEFEVTAPENVGFHRDHAPDTWEAESETVSVEHSLGASETSRLMLGIVTGDRSVPEAAVMTHPDITNAKPIDEVVEGSTGDDSNGQSDPSLYERAKKSLMAGDGGPGTEKSDSNGLENGRSEIRDEVEDDVGKDTSDGSDGDLELDLDLADENGEQAPETAGSDSPTDETSSKGETAADRDESTTEPLKLELDESSDELNDESSDESEHSRERESERAEQNDSERPSDGSNSEQPPRKENPDQSRESEMTSKGVCATLIEELEAGTVPEEDLDALRAYLSAETARSDEEPSRSDELRLSHVQSRLDDLAAYVEMFEQFVDERGTFQEFADEADGAINGIETELEALDDSIDKLRTEQQTANEDIESLRDRLDEREAEFTETVEGFERRQETTASELDRLETELEAELDEIRTKLDQFERLAEALESVFRTDDMDALEGV